MKLVKPSWMQHEGPVFSLDIHPDGQKIATAGRDSVRLWSLQDVVSDSDGHATPLSVLSNDIGSVHCTRWSRSGSLLATCSDNRLVMVWQQSDVVQASFGEKYSESWRRIAAKNEHTHDVMTVEWSPEDRWLASCSVDTSVIIWDVPSFNALRVLKGHDGHVKGLAWDPIGKYLASQGSDNTVRVWRTDNWECEQVVKEPFKKSAAGSVFFQRLGWTTDGQYILAGGAKNSHASVCVSIARGGFAREVDLVGHAAPVTAVRANPVLFVPKGAQSSEHHYSAAVIGGQDCALSVWLMGKPRPLTIIHDMFKDTIHDSSWSRDGRNLALCSGDGTVGFLLFEEGELGIPLSKEDQDRVLRQTYGSAGAVVGGIAESATQLLHERLTTVSTSETAARPPPKPSRRVTPMVVSPSRPQVESRTKDGKRRITPMLLQPSSASTTQMQTDVPPPAIEPRGPVIRKAAAPADQTQAPPRKRGRPPATSHAPVAAPQHRMLGYPRPPTNHTFTVTLSSPKPAFGQDEVATVLEIVNDVSQLTATHGLHKVACIRGGEPLWEQFLPRSLCLAAGTSSFVAVASEHGEIHVFSSSVGSRLLPPLVLGSPASLLYAEDDFLVAVSSNATLCIWNIRTTTAVYTDLSLRPVVSGINGDLVDVFLSKESKEPIVRVADASDSSKYPRPVRAYLYHERLKTWLEVGDASSSVTLTASTASSLQRAGPGALARAQNPLSSARILSSHALANGLKQMPAGHKVDATIAQFEYQLACAASMHSANEFEQAMHRYVKFLATEELETRLRTLCAEYHGPPSASGLASAAEAQQWSPHVLGLPNVQKRALLRGMLSDIAGANRRLQRLVEEFKEVLDEIERREQGS